MAKTFVCVCLSLSSLSVYPCLSFSLPFRSRRCLVRGSCNKNMPPKAQGVSLPFRTRTLPNAHTCHGDSTVQQLFSRNCRCSSIGRPVSLVVLCNDCRPSQLAIARLAHTSAKVRASPGPPPLGYISSSAPAKCGESVQRHRQRGHVPFTSSFEDKASRISSYRSTTTSSSPCSFALRSSLCSSFTSAWRSLNVEILQFAALALRWCKISTTKEENVPVLVLVMQRGVGG